MRELWISTAVLTAIVLLLRRIFRGKVPYRYLYGLWLLVVLRLCVPVSIGNSPLSLSTLLNQMTPGISQEEGSTVTVQKAVTVPTDAPVIVKQKVVEADQKQWQAGKDQNDTSSQMAESSGRKALDLPVEWMLMLVWLAGIVAMAVILLTANIKMSRRLRKSRKQIDITKRYGLSVYEVESIQVPCLYGILHPAVYMPSAICETLTEQEKQWVYCHEEMHYHHRDHVWAFVRALLVVSYWFHPCVWVAAAYSRRDAEYACDEAVLWEKEVSDKIEYGEMLISVARQKQRYSLLYPSTAVISDKKELKKRMKVIVGKGTYKKWAVALTACLAVVGVAFTFSGCGKEKKETAGEKAATAVVSQSETKSVDNTEKNKLIADFLQKEKNKCKMFSVVRLGEEKEPVLLVLKEKVKQVSSQAQLYFVQNGKVVRGQKAACSSSGEWIHYNEGVLYADTHHSLTGYNWQAGKIEETTLEEKTDQYDSEFSKNIFWNFQVADSVIFLDNTDKNRSRISSGTYEDETVFQKKILSGGSSYMTDYKLVRDGKNSLSCELVVNETNAMISDSKPVIQVKTTENGKKNVIWSDTANVYEKDKGVQYYITGTGADALFLRVVKTKGSYQWQQFYLTKDGKEQITAEDSVTYDLSKPSAEASREMSSFINKLWKNRLEDAAALFSTCDYLDISPVYNQVFYKELKKVQKELEK